MYRAESVFTSLFYLMIVYKESLNKANMLTCRMESDEMNIIYGIILITLEYHKSAKNNNGFNDNN